MPNAKAVQISIDPVLLARIDADPEVQERGRSAFVRSAVRQYLAAKERRAIDAALTEAYRGHAEELREEIDDLLAVQAWPGE